MWSIFIEYQDQTEKQEELILRIHGEAKYKGLQYLAQKAIIKAIKQEQESKEKGWLLRKQEYRKELENISTENQDLHESILLKQQIIKKKREALRKLSSEQELY